MAADTTTEASNTGDAHASNQARVGGTLAKMASQVSTAQIRYELWRQDAWWVPEPAWKAFCEHSARFIKTGPVLGFDRLGQVHTIIDPDVATFTHPAKRAVADLDADYRNNIAGHCWRQSRSVCSALAWRHVFASHPFGEPDDGARHFLEQEADHWTELATDEELRRAWFGSLPLITALRTRNRSCTGPAILG